MIAYAATTVTPSLDTWALGITVLKHLDPPYVESTCLKVDHLAPHTTAFGFSSGCSPFPDEDVVEVVNSMSKIYSPVCFGRNYLKNGKVNAALYGEILAMLLVAPNTRSTSMPPSFQLEVTRSQILTHTCILSLGQIL